jgi:hypothetical protein
VAFAAYNLLRPELFNAVFAALLDRGYLFMGLVSSILSLGVAAMAAPRICHGLNGWIRHLPARGLTHRRLAGIAITLSLIPILLVLSILSLIAFKVYKVSPYLYLSGLPILGLAAGLCVLPVTHNYLSKTLALSACVLSTSGHWLFLFAATILLIIADLTAGNLSPPRKPHVSQRSLPASWINVLIVLRALRLRILFPYLPPLFVLGLTSLFLSNNTLTPHQIFRGVIFGGTLSISMLFAFIANSLAIRRPPWPWARSLPWAAKQRITADAILIGLSAIPILLLVFLLKSQSIWPVMIYIPPLALFASLSVRRAFENQLGAVWQTLIVGTTASMLVCLIPFVSIVFLAATPLLIKHGAEQEQKQKVSVWLEMHHLAAGDSLSWSRQ